MEKIKEAFEKSATRYPYTVFDLLKPQFYRRSMKRAEKALGSEKEIGRILDLGCGTAYFTSLLTKFYTQVVGIDLSENMIQVAKNSLEHNKMKDGIEFVVADGEYLPFIGGAFDVVLCLDLLHHVPDVASIIREMTRAIRKGGKVVSIEPNFLNPLYVLLCFIASQENLSKFYRASPRFLRKLFTENNIRDISVGDLDYVPQFFLKLTPFPDKLSRFLEYIENLLGRHPTLSFFLSSHFITKGTR